MKIEEHQQMLDARSIVGIHGGTTHHRLSAWTYSHLKITPRVNHFTEELMI